MGNQLFLICQDFMDFMAPITKREIQIVCLKIQSHLMSFNLSFSEQDFILAFDIAESKLNKIETSATFWMQFESKAFIAIIFFLLAMLYEYFTDRNTTTILILVVISFGLAIFVILKVGKVMQEHYKCFSMTFAIRFLAEQNNFDVGGRK